MYCTRIAVPFSFSNLLFLLAYNLILPKTFGTNYNYLHPHFALWIAEAFNHEGGE